jgi:hypothetical protein
MPAIEFGEIPSGNRGGGKQDKFELFARDCLEFLGFHPVTSPARGPDFGKDFIVEEVRRGAGGETRIRWLVSCKHFAHSGASVSPTDEQNIRERVESHQCDGFVGFYSTLPSSGLSQLLERLKGIIEVQLYDGERIERYLLESPAGVHLAQRYFPRSIEQWKQRTSELSVSAAPVLSLMPYAVDESHAFHEVSVWNVILWTNDVESLFWRVNDTGSNVHLYCRTPSRVGLIASASLSEADARRLSSGAAEIDLWTFYDAHKPNDDSRWGLLKLQYKIKRRKVVSLYRLSPTQREYLYAKLREFLDDWDE